MKRTAAPYRLLSKRGHSCHHSLEYSLQEEGLLEPLNPDYGLQHTTIQYLWTSSWKGFRLSRGAVSLVFKEWVNYLPSILKKLQSTLGLRQALQSTLDLLWLMTNEVDMRTWGYFLYPCLLLWWSKYHTTKKHSGDFLGLPNLTQHKIALQEKHTDVIKAFVLRSACRVQKRPAFIYFSLQTWSDQRKME